MPTTSLHLSPPPPSATTPSPLPTLLHTPHGLLLLEIQGTLNLPASAVPTPIGRLVFPHLDADNIDGDSEGRWMKRVELYVGANQRLVGEVRALKGGLGVLRRREGDAVEVLDVVRWKVVFAARPEFV